MSPPPPELAPQRRRAWNLAARRAPAPRLSGASGAPLLRGWLHLTAFVASVPLGLALAARSGWLAPVDGFAAAEVMLFGVSAAYHLVPMPPTPRRWMRRVDHAMIYVFIAAGMTPLFVLVVGGTEGSVVLGLAWFGAAAGVVAKLTAFERTQVAAGVFYFALGGLSAVTLPVTVARLDATETALLFLTGAFYLAGSAVLACRRPDPSPAVFGYHEVWHALVVLAAGSYFADVWLFVARPPG